MSNSKRTYIGRGREVESEDLDDLTFARVVARRARTLGRKLLDTRVEAGKGLKAAPSVRGEVGDAETKRRKDQERFIERYYEKVHEQADFLPARFLQDGANHVPAVCRMAVVTPEGKRYTGTGFLIAPGFIMTNNHVLENQDWAEDSLAIFHFQEGGTAIRVPLEPERFFITDEGLDFTIVGCNAGRVLDIAPIPLLQNSALITRHDRVYIIQHPAGRPKEVVLRDNEVVRVRDRVLRYRADTEGGSSGSPVFNESWQLVALHHAGWYENGSDRAVNEGISMPAIIRHLQGLGGRESGGVRGVEDILGTIGDSSPFLGFFDHRSSQEVSVDTFSGSSDYADIGFWNIEHFNRHVNSSRVASVADVVSRLALDAFGLTEVEEGALDRLVERLEQFGDSYGFVHHDAPGNQDIAILYDRDTTLVEKLDDIYQRHEGRLNARTPSGKTAFPRQPLFAECLVQERAEDDPVRFVMIVLHLKAYVTDPPSRERRALAAQMLSEIVDDIRERLELPVVIGGDYNELITTDVLAPLKDSPDLFALTTDDAADGGISYVGRRYRSLIDHIIVSKDVPLGAIQGDDAAIVRLDRSVADFVSDASDHVPLVMRMVYREDPVEPPPGDESTLDIPEGATQVKLTFE